MQKTSITIGIIFAIMCFMMGSIAEAFIKLLASDYTVAQIIFLRSLISLIFVMSIAFYKKEIKMIETFKFHQHLIRAVYLLSGLAFVILSLRYIPIADFTAIIYASPFFVILLSWPMLKEKVSKKLIIATLVGFVGVLFIVNPHSVAFGIGGFFGICATFCAALTIIQTRKMSWSETPLSISFWLGVIGVIITTPFIAFEWITPSLMDCGVFILIGVLHSLLQIFLSIALKHAPASVVTPFDYSGFIWAVLLGYLFWGDIPTQMMLFGTAIIVLSGLYIAHSERVAEDPSLKLKWKNPLKKSSKVEN